MQRLPAHSFENFQHIDVSYYAVPILKKQFTIIQQTVTIFTHP